MLYHARLDFSLEVHRCGVGGREHQSGSQLLLLLSNLLSNDEINDKYLIQGCLPWHRALCMFTASLGLENLGRKKANAVIKSPDLRSIQHARCIRCLHDLWPSHGAAPDIFVLSATRYTQGVWCHEISAASVPNDACASVTAVSDSAAEVLWLCRSPPNPRSAPLYFLCPTFCELSLRFVHCPWYLAFT